MIVFAVPGVFEGYKQGGYHFYVVPKAVPVIQIALTGSVYCTVAISLERYLTVCHPFYIAGNKWSAKRYIIPILIFSLLYNTSRFFEMRTKSIDLRIQHTHNSTRSINQNKTALDNIQFMNLSGTITLRSNISSENSDFIVKTNGNVTNKLNLPKYNYEIQLTSMRKNKYYYSVYIIGLNLFVNGLIPFALLIILNTLLYKQLKLIVSDTSTKQRSSSIIRSASITPNQHQNVHPEEDGLIQNKKERIKPSEIMLAKVSILIVFVFIVCHSIRWIPNMYELIQRIYSEDGNIEWPDWVESITQISHFLTIC
jgi:hypothetical protein